LSLIGLMASTAPIPAPFESGSHRNCDSQYHIKETNVKAEAQPVLPTNLLAHTAAAPRFKRNYAPGP